MDQFDEMDQSAQQAQQRRLLVAMVLVMALLFGYPTIINLLYGPPKPPDSPDKPGAAATATATGTGAAGTGTGAAATGTGTGTGKPADPATPTAKGTDDKDKEKDPKADDRLKPVPVPAPEGGKFEPVTLGAAAAAPNADVDTGETAVELPHDVYRYGVWIDPETAAVRTVRLGEFKSYVRSVFDFRPGEPGPMALLRPLGADAGGAESFRLGKVTVDGVEVPLGVRDWATVSATPERAEFRMVLAAKGKDVLEIRKVFAVHPRAEESQAGEGLGYVLDVNLSARSLDGSAHKVSFEMLGPVGVPHETKAPDDRKVVWGERSERYRDTRRVLKTWDELVAALGDKSKPFPGIADKPEPASLVWYAGAMNRFFAALVLPDRLTGEANGAAVPPSEWQAVEIRHLPTPRDYEPDEKPGHDFATVFRIAADVPASGKEAKASAGAGEGWSRGYHVYLGPKRKELLEAVQTRYAADFALPKIIDYAQFSCFCDALGCGDYIGKFIGYPLLRLLDIIHYIIPNYGVAIIVMVIIVRAVLYPISRKSAMSMLRMKELQPKLAEIQAKYADNREELGRKQMELYQKEGINPVGGCLPMLLQMPIWIGLWGALSAAVDLRHAPFMLWMRDLAGQDSLVHFAHAPSLALPLCGQVSLPLSLNVLPLVMAIFMFIQSKQMTAQQPTNPDAPDPRIMTYMTTGLFVWMLYTAPAGLNLYIMTSTIFGLLEQKWVKDHYEELKAKGLLAPKEGGKPGFFARLIEKVREIQEQQETEGTGGGKSGGANLSKGDGNSGSGGSGEGGGGGGGGRRKKRKK